MNEEIRATTVAEIFEYSDNHELLSPGGTAFGWTARTAVRAVSIYDVLICAGAASDGRPYRDSLAPGVLDENAVSVH